MNNFKLINNIFGWLSFVFALTVYALTLEPTGSLWDCGEFISAAFRLQVVHPPGAPLFLMIGRIFTIFAGDDPSTAAIAVNLFSGTASALCVMFTFWITTYFAGKIVEKKYGESTTLTNWLVIVSGLVAAGTLTFTDTFWFSAVEAEVYAASSFFMAFTFWCILKWERVSEEKFANKWLVFIGYVVGLAIGVHLLNLLVIPGIVLVYYFKKYAYSPKGLIYALGLGFILLFFVQLIVIPGIPSLAAKFDLFFVNSMGMGFGSGVWTFSIILLAGLVFGLWYSQKTHKVALNTALLGFAFILIGYSSYSMVVIRSQANTPIDMNNPEDPLNLVYYLNREQYGDRPLLKGPHFMTEEIRREKGKLRYIRGEKGYIEAGYDIKQIFNPQQLMIFPRIYDQNDPNHERGYRDWGKIPEKQVPKFSNNLTFFFNYQLGHMYWRYFFWNFAGRQNDDQGMNSTDVLSGNWITGIKPLDAMRLGPQQNMPDKMKDNPSRNTYYLLPFILGIIGLILQVKTDKNGSLINGVLFIVTGVMLIIYLNPPPYEPRERDYVFVGSFQVFCTWVGLGVMGLFVWISKYLNRQTGAAIAVVAGLVGGPYVLGSQNWDDHDRSGRYMSTDFARNYLKSCAPNAILFTNGDNDTYPLWYLQNTEGYRTDVRVINLSLLNASDYAESLRKQQYESAPIKLSFTEQQIQPGTRDYVPFYNANNMASENAYYDLKDILAFMANDKDPRAKVTSQNGEPMAFFPAKKLFIKVDKDKVIQHHIVAPKLNDSIVSEMRFELPVNGLSRSSLILLDVIANNMWERPIYFTTTTGTETYLGLQGYFQLDGLTYQLVPIASPITADQSRNRDYGFIDTDKMYAQLVDSFTWGGMENGPMWVDDKMRLVPRVMRATFVRTARELISQGNKAKAIALLADAEKSIPDMNMPYDGYMIEFLETYYMAGDTVKAAAVADKLIENSYQKALYLKQFSVTKYPGVVSELNFSRSILDYVKNMAVRFQDKTTEQKASAKLAEVQ